MGNGPGCPELQDCLGCLQGISERVFVPGFRTVSRFAFSTTQLRRGPTRTRVGVAPAGFCVAFAVADRTCKHNSYSPVEGRHAHRKSSFL